jgi:hypothetical protein
MSICGDLIDSADKDGTFLNWIITRDERWLFWGRMWICVSACEYLIIWCDKATVHKIIDCGSIINWKTHLDKSKNLIKELRIMYYVTLNTIKGTRENNKCIETWQNQILVMCED